MTPLCFMRGRRLYQIANAREGEGFIGICDGRVVVHDANRANVARSLIRGDHRQSFPPASALSGTGHSQSGYRLIPPRL